jgi:hypothetical protein
MSEEQLILSPVGDIYDAALDPSLWPRALQGVCGFVGGSMANIFWQDVIAKRAKRGFEWGNDPYYTELYMETYAKTNPLFPAAYHFPVGQVFCQCEVMSYDELHETRIYKEWMQPQGYVDFIGCHLEKSASACVPATVIRHERDGLVDDQAMARMRLIVPHIRRAALIGNVIDLKTYQAWAEESCCGCWGSRFPSSSCLPCFGTEAAIASFQDRRPASAGLFLESDIPS